MSADVSGVKRKGLSFPHDFDTKNESRYKYRFGKIKSNGQKLLKVEKQVDETCIYNRLQRNPKISKSM